MSKCRYVDMSKCLDDLYSRRDVDALVVAVAQHPGACVHGVTWRISLVNKFYRLEFLHVHPSL